MQKDIEGEVLRDHPPTPPAANRDYKKIQICVAETDWKMLIDLDKKLNELSKHTVCFNKFIEKKKKPETVVIRSRNVCYYIIPSIVPQFIL